MIEKLIAFRAEKLLVFMMKTLLVFMVEKSDIFSLNIKYKIVTTYL